jgi:cytochrome c-type biogenesis protein CcmH
MLGLGTLIALLPESTFAFAAAGAAAVAGRRAASTAGLVLLLLLSSPAPVRGQVTVFTALERSLRSDIMCTCGCRRSLALCGMPNCHGEAEQMALMRTLISEGKDRDQVLAAFVEKQGVSALMVPPNEGFNRTAWVFPAIAGVAGLVLVGVTAVRWTRRPRPLEEKTTDAIDPTLDARLDDELRDLD